MNEDKATRYHRLRRRAAGLGASASAAFLLVVLVTGGSAWLRAWLDTGSPWLDRAGYVAVLAASLEVTRLPAAWYLGVLERRYGLSTVPLGRWWAERVKGMGVGLALALTAASFVWLLLRWSPDHWWIGAAAVCAVALIAVAHLAPAVLLPRFYTVTPLARPELSRRLVALAARAGAPVIGVFEWRVSDRTTRANAALAGLGRTRRILLSDTLLAGQSDDEIEVVVAHEIAHHVHRDVWASIAFETVLAALAGAAADRALAAVVGSFGVTGKSDAAALPVLLLAGGAVSTLLLPISNALSRAHERRADRVALELTGNADAFVRTMRRLGTRNLADPHVSRAVEVLFHSHPTMAARIEAAESFGRPGRSDRSRRSGRSPH